MPDSAVKGYMGAPRLFYRPVCFGMWSGSAYRRCIYRTYLCRRL